MWRIFYEQDIRRPLSAVYAEVRSVYVAPTDRAINGYERLGRIIAGTLLVLAWLGLCSFVVGAFVGLIVLAFEWIKA
jgi:hypothetical protein